MGKSEIFDETKYKRLFWLQITIIIYLLKNKLLTINYYLILLLIDELIGIKKLFLTNMFHLKISNEINHKINMNNLIAQEEEINISDKQVVYFYFMYLFNSNI